MHEQVRYPLALFLSFYPVALWPTVDHLGMQEKIMAIEGDGTSLWCRCRYLWRSIQVSKFETLCWLNFEIRSHLGFGT